MVEPSSIEQSIRTGLACTHLEVQGDGAHFEAVIVSRRSRLTRCAAPFVAELGERMRPEIQPCVKTFSP